MDTQITRIDISSPGWDKQLDPVAEVLRAGGLVAFPTETVYGLGANALSPLAIEGIYRAKGRPVDNPLIVHIDDISLVSDLAAVVPETAPLLMATFWPGPLTLIMQKTDIVPFSVTGGLDTVAIRMPSHPIALELLRKTQLPIAAPSANSSGRSSPTMAKHVIDDLYGKIDIIIDGGDTKVGLESTVLDLTQNPPAILRPGGVTLEQLRHLLGEVEVCAEFSGKSSAPRSPGMKYRHYAPKGILFLIQGSDIPMTKEISKRAYQYVESGVPTGILTTDETALLYPPSLSSLCKICSLGSKSRPEELASNLFGRLREFDEESIELILAEAPDTNGIGLAILNRLLKAAGGTIIKV